MLLDVQVIRVSEIPRLTAGGVVSKLLLVTYMVGPHGPFSREFPVEGFTVAGAMIELETFAATIRGLAGASG